jgi:hypothetical protein
LPTDPVSFAVVRFTCPGTRRPAAFPSLARIRTVAGLGRLAISGPRRLGKGVAGMELILYLLEILIGQG